MCTGDVRVEAEYTVRGMLGRGMIDYVIMYKHFSITVVEVSWCGVAGWRENALAYKQHML